MKSSFLVFILLAAACGGGDDDAADAGPPDARPFPDAPLNAPDASLMPETLAETGLYVDLASETLAPGVVEYTVNYPLWADGADKRRWVLLPEGATIDTTDMDFWSLPAGTKLWKEFTRDGVRIETRLLWKQGPTDAEWYSMSYAWNADRTGAEAAPFGAQNALGTAQDIPRSTDCKTCHERQPGFALGFSALQLDHDQGDINLASLASSGRLSSPPSRTTAPVFPLPGDEVARSALGYLHGNCGPCHNEHSDVFRERTGVVWHLDSDALATVEATSVYRTSVGVPPLIPLSAQYTSILEPGDPAASAAVFRMSQRDPTEDSKVPMPPLATDDADTQGGIAAVSEWVDSLGP